ncbi:hypothetical protein J4436_04295 [Candidatus Woesearchaeota archaeon]|nr:hypothetical protein [Candidatus Woesearchaeota archaeon]
MKKFIAVSAPLIQDIEINEVIKTLKSGWLGAAYSEEEIEYVIDSINKVIKDVRN